MIIPVLDLKDGEAVSGKSGDRDNYKPLKTIYHPTSNPLDIVKALKKKGFQRIYVADLDSIEGKGSNLSLIKKMNNIIPLMLDAGTNSIQSFKHVSNHATWVIIATETLERLEDLKTIFQVLPSSQIIISIDIREGQIWSRKGRYSVDQVKELFKKINPREIILLDISGVGREKGYNRTILRVWDEFKGKIILGGGITLDDLQQLPQIGYYHFLVGTALHSGKIRNY